MKVLAMLLASFFFFSFYGSFVQLKLNSCQMGSDEKITKEAEMDDIKYISAFLTTFKNVILKILNNSNTESKSATDREPLRHAHTRKVL